VAGCRDTIAFAKVQPAQGIELTGRDQESGALMSGVPPAGSLRPRRRPTLSLRSRLLLLVVASVVPLIGMGVVREYWNYRAKQDQVYEGLQTAARGLAVAVERDLQSRVTALETLATSPALQSGDLAQFDRQAEAFLARQAPDVRLGLAAPDATLVRLYGPQAGVVQRRVTCGAGLTLPWRRMAP